jgi:anti-sigma regulatory factor (Ser/Thr protein kinase)
VAEDLVHDILLSSREAVLNAILHGCGPGAFARFVLSYAPASRAIRARVEDPGPGYGIDIRRRETSPLSEVRGRGLQLIRHLSHSCTAERGGAHLLMEWMLSSAKERSTKTHAS